MRIWIKIAVFFCTVMAANAQIEQQLNQYLQTSQSADQDKVFEKVELLIKKIGSNPNKSDRHFLRSIFTITHRQVLKQYDQYSEFGDLFASGRYDCLTATALYSVILSHFGFEHQVIETNYHIFLLIQSNEGLVLMESTDPIGGFEYQKNRIEDRIAMYANDYQQPVSDTQFVSSYSIFNEVSFNQLTGLLYYNQSVKAFNTQQWMEADRLLNLAKQFYYSPRIVEMENLLVSTLASLELENANYFHLDFPVGPDQLAMRNH